MRRLVRAAGLVGVTAAVLALPAAGAPTDPPEGVTATGVGTVSTRPDTSEWLFGVTTRSASARTALNGNAAVMARVAAAVRSAGVADADVQTQSASLYPRTARKTRKVTYFANGYARVVVRNLSRVGDVVNAAVGAGATGVEGPSLGVSQAKELYASALDLAYDDALAKARRLAAKSGLVLGRPVAVVEGQRDGFRAYASAEFAGGGAFEIEPGLNEISATVTVTFAAT